MQKLADNEKKLLAAASAYAATCIPMRFDGVSFSSKLTIFDGSEVKLTYWPKSIDNCPVQIYSGKAMKVFTGYSWDQCFEELFDEYRGQNDTN